MGRNGFTLPIAALLFLKMCSNERITIEISTYGKKQLLKCDYKLNATEPRYWRKLSQESEGKSYQDIFDGRKLLTNISQIYKVVSNTSDLIIQRITDKEAGIYQCPHNKIHLIVVDNNITCNEAPYTDSNIIYTDIKCSFSFKADESCHIKPFLRDQMTNRSIGKHEIDYIGGYDDGYVWVRFEGNSYLGYSNGLGLGVIFNCSSNAISYYYDNHFTFNGNVAGKKLFIVIVLVILIPILIIVCFAIKRRYDKKKKKKDLAVVISPTETVLQDTALQEDNNIYEELDENMMVQSVYCNIKN